MLDTCFNICATDLFGPILFYAIFCNNFIFTKMHLNVWSNGIFAPRIPIFIKSGLMKEIVYYIQELYKCFICLQKYTSYCPRYKIKG